MTTTENREVLQGSDDAAWREAVENTEDPFGKNFAAILGDEADPFLNGEWRAKLGDDPDPLDVAAALIECGEDVCSVLFDQFMTEREEWLTRRPVAAGADHS